MRIPPIAAPIILTTALLFTACEKIQFSEETESTTTTNTDCPDLSALIVRENEEDEAAKTAQLLAYFTAEEIADLRANTCLAIDPAEGGVEDRASGVKNKFWAPGKQIRVRFLNGNAALQQKVFDCAKAWEAYADVQFTRVSSGASEVRVLFGNDGHWSYIGTDHVGIDACKQTMSLELKDNTAAGEIRRVALHEFGHVLGMRHEHQQPLASIPWNTNAVYAYYAQQDWSKQTVDEQVLNKNSAESTQNTTFDAQSIMEYPVSASLTTNGFSIPWNNQLSAIDKAFIGMMYSSQRIRVRHAISNYSANVTFVLDGIYHTLRPGESIQAPAYTSNNQLSIKEQNGTWDNGYTPAYGKQYKIVRVGTSSNLTLALE